MTLPEKKIAVLEKIMAELDEMINQARQSANEAQEEANYHIGAMQSRYDTFKEEAQYLNAAQKLRMLELENARQECQSLMVIAGNTKVKVSEVSLGAAFSIQDENGGVKSFFVAPFVTKLKLVHEGVTYLCATPKAPVVSPFIGRREGDYVEIKLTGFEGLLCEWYISKVQ